MFQQKASTKRTVRGSTDTVFSRMAAFDILPGQQLVLHRKVHPYLQSKRHKVKELPEQKKKKKVPPFNFSRTKNISLPEYEFSPPGSSALLVPAAPAPWRWRHWLYSVSIGIRQVKSWPGTSTTHTATRVTRPSGMALRPRTQGNPTGGRGQKGESG